MAQLKPELIGDFSGGTNLTGAPLNIGEHDLLLCENMHPVASGYLVGRGGQATYNATGLGLAPVKSLYRFYKQNGTGITLAACGTGMARGDDALHTFSFIDSGYTANQRFSFTTWTAKDKVYWINNAQVLKSYDGTTVAIVGGSPPIGSQVEMYLDRLWILLPNGVRFSDLNVDNVWQGAALLNISDSKGGTGQFLKAANRLLIAGKSTGLWRLDGSPLLGNAFIQFSDVGCAAAWTADVVTTISSGQVTPVGVVFLGKDGVYITDGYNVRLISQQLEPSGTPLFGNYRNAVGKFYPKKRQYFLSFDTAGGPNDTLWCATNIDVAGSKIAWSEYTGFNVDSMSVWDGGSDNGDLLAGLSTSDGKVRMLDTGSLDLAAPYTCKFTTRYFGDPSGNKQVRWLKPVFDAQKSVHYLINYFEKQQSSGPVSVDQSTALIWDSGLWDQGTWAGPSLNSARTSVLDYHYGRYYNTTVENTGDGPNFRFFQLAVEHRVKDRRFHDVFTLNQTP